MPSDDPTIAGDAPTTSDAESQTRIKPPTGGRPQSGPPTWPSAPPAAGQGRFAPGTILAGRYRIVSLLGRGGMGEVYRADDLRLGQTVAFKLLPAALATDAQRLAQFHGEVRTARQVTHQNVCRVYDIGDVDGALYLTMEYVDGEDLATSLRRIGRVPEDRAIEIARQLCAGLAAAHACGIIHRDLKPANIMIDSQGRVRLMDFGLAVAESVTGEVAGTPVYMAPEQIEGRTVTPASDIYALGLVLYELFTGRRAFQAQTIAELVSLKSSGTMARPTTIVASLNPRVERAILDCVSLDPAARPGSALAVSAALAGGDELAAAIAAGEVPSPQMVAAAGGDAPTLTARAGAAWIAAVVALVVIVGWMADRATVVGQTAIAKPADVLAEYARQVRAAAGYPAAPAYEAYGFGFNAAPLIWVTAHGAAGRQWRDLVDGDVTPVRFWYRGSANRLDPVDPLAWRGPNDPATSQPGDNLVILDTRARLIAFVAIPAADVAERGSPGPAPWDSLFKAAGLDRARLTDAPAAFTPRSFADERRTFIGTFPSRPDLQVRVNAAALGGRPTEFVVSGPWEQAALPRPAGAWLEPWLQMATAVVQIGLIVFAVGLAVVQIRRGRVDWPSALRMAGFAFAMFFVSYLVRPAHSGDASRESYRFFANVGMSLFYGLIFGAAYVGFEPFVRQYWPHALVGWTRLLAGRARDAVVGRDVLVGVAAGLGLAVLMFAYQVVPQIAGWPSPPGWLFVSTSPADGLASGVSRACLNVNLSFVSSFGAMIIVAAIRHRVRAPSLAVALSTLLLALLDDFATGIGYDEPWRLLLVSVGVALPLVLVLIRWGLLAGVAAAIARTAVTAVVFTLDPARPYFAFSIVTAFVLTAIAFAGWRFGRGTSRGTPRASVAQPVA